MKSLFATFQFMTRIPVPESWTKDFDFNRFVEGIVWFPLVGVVVGAFAAAAFYFANQLFDSAIAAACYVLALALITGGFHLDGLADTCDAIFSARKREQMLEIMKDSRLGTNGGLALIFIVVFRVLVVNHLATSASDMVLFYLIAAPVAGRALMVILMYRQTYARESGLGNVFIGKVTAKQTLITLATSLMLVALLGQISAIRAWFFTLIFAYGYQRFIHKRLGGQTGDTLGGGNELFELCFLLMLF